MVIAVVGALLAACNPSHPPIAFGKNALAGASSSFPTSLQFGPDRRLYVAQFDGKIKAYTVQRTDANVYSVRATETIPLIAQIPNHDDDGTLNPSVDTRLITGMLVLGSSTNPVIYVSSSDPRIGGGSDGELTNLDTNSSMISRLDKVAGVWRRRDLVRGLPRSQENHAANGLVLDSTTNSLYVAIGGNTNMGAPSHNFNFLPEVALSAAILRIDLNAIGDGTYDLPTLTSDRYPGLTGPFGGDFGRRQARLVSGGPVQVYAPGFRNPYDLVITRAGKMYSIDNGPNAGWGGPPQSEGPAGVCTNDVVEPGATESDTLHLIDGPGYYGGHPNPTRGNRANTFNASPPQSPVETANPVECDHRGLSEKGALTSFPTATTGFAEYTASNFRGRLSGDLVVADWYGDVYRVDLSPGGNAVNANDVIFSNVSAHPIDVVAQSDSDFFPGTIWVADFATAEIWVFEPTDYGGGAPPSCAGAHDYARDDDRDGFSNADELDNQTDPCSAADIPHDWDTDFTSDLNDPDDDNDNALDTSDPFAIDASNGLGTALPVEYSWDNGAPNPGGLLGLGWTGLMTDGRTDYASLYDAMVMTAGGAAGAMTVDQVPSGDAYGAGNTQQFGFQFGVDARPSQAGVFTVRTRITGPFAGRPPRGKESMGVFVGSGDQDNYVKLVTGSNGGTSGIELLREVSGAPQQSPQAPVPLPGPEAVDLFLIVDPSRRQVRGAFRLISDGSQGALTSVGVPVTVPASWFDGTAQGLAVGVIATSSGGTPFAATWDAIDVLPGAPK